MSEAIGTITDTILYRIRDAGGVAIPRTTVYPLIGEAERLLNHFHDWVRGQAVFTQTPRRCLYETAAITTVDGHTASRIRRISFNGRDLTKVAFRVMGQSDRHWWRAQGPQPLMWAECGLTHFVVYPAPILETQLMLFVTPLFLLPLADTDVVNVRDEYVRPIVDLVVLWCLVRQRLFGPGTISLWNQLRSTINMPEIPLVG